jgi:predicted Zn-dependent protease
MKFPTMNHVARRIAVAAVGILLLTHCAKNPVTGGKDFVLMSEQQEIQMGAQAHKDVMKEYGMLENPQLQAYVTRVGKALAAKSHRPNLDWHFTVVDSPEVNAFALPGGYIYVTRGIMAYLNSEAELAGVLGHEIGHVTARHGVRQQSAATAAGLGAILGSILVPGLDNQAGATLLQQLSQSLIAGYGREHELESDRLGAEYLAKTAYNPQAMVEVIGVLKNQELYDIELAKKEGREPRRYHGLFDTHPSNDARLKQVVGEANKYKVANPREGREEFIHAMNGVYFGDSPDQGVIRGNALLHEKLGIAVQFPKGWRVQNQPDRVAAINPQGTAMVELKPGPKNAQPMDTLQKALKLDQGARYESGNVNGNPAAFAAGAQQGKPVLVAAINFSNSQYLLAGIAKDGTTYNQNRTTLKDSISSFRAITQQERQLARPYVIRAVQAQPGMTMASLAAQSPLGSSAEPQLRLMNDLYPTGEPAPGQLIKIVQ